jgi:DNA (cytosine-5)-methyltransferase 1
MRFFDAFAGIGGFHLGIKQAKPGWECIGACDIDKDAIKVYKEHFPEVEMYGNIREMDKLPERTECLCGGFPCEAFSTAGKRGGFNDERGTLFFELARLIGVSKPKTVFLENVKGLLQHDKGRTFGEVLYTLGKLGYWWEYQLLNSADFGVPQDRKRVFIIGHIAEAGGSGTPVFPIRKVGEAGSFERRSSVQKQSIIQTLTASDYDNLHGNFLAIPILTPHRLNKRQNGRRMKENGEPAFCLNAQDQHGVFLGENKMRRLTPIEWERLQGFPDNWTASLSDMKRYKVLGKAVSVPVIKAIAERFEG